MTDQSTPSSRGDDDTIELQLTPEQLMELSAAAAASDSDADRSARNVRLAQPAFGARTARRFHAWHPTALAKMAVASAAYASLAWLGAAKLAGQPEHPSVTAPTAPTGPVLQPAVLAIPPQPPLRVANPFDATEVFEFPAGTTPAESRDKVAQLLLQRAQERQSEWRHNGRPK